MEGNLVSPPCVLDTGNPCRYDEHVGLADTPQKSPLAPLLQRGYNLGYAVLSLPCKARTWDNGAFPPLDSIYEWHNTFTP